MTRFDQPAAEPCLIESVRGRRRISADARVRLKLDGNPVEFKRFFNDGFVNQDDRLSRTVVIEADAIQYVEGVS